MDVITYPCWGPWRHILSSHKLDMKLFRLRTGECYIGLESLDIIQIYHLRKEHQHTDSLWPIIHIQNSLECHMFHLYVYYILRNNGVTLSVRFLSTVHTDRYGQWRCGHQRINVVTQDIHVYTKSLDTLQLILGVTGIACWRKSTFGNIKCAKKWQVV